MKFKDGSQRSEVNSQYYSVKGSFAGSRSSKKEKLFSNLNSKHMEKMSFKKSEIVPQQPTENSARKGSTTSGITTRSKKNAFSNLN